MGLLGLNDDEAMLMAASLLSGKGNAMANMGGGLLGVHGYRQGETERSLNNIRLTQAKQGLADDTQARQILMGGQGEAVPYGKGAAVSNVPSMGGGMPNMGGPGNVNPGQSGGKMATFNKYNAIADQFEHAGLIDKAKQYRDIAEKSRPEVKEVRTMTQNGQRVSVAIYKDGTSEVMPYNPDLEKLHFADNGSSIQGLNTFTGAPEGPSVRKTMSPGESARLGQEERHFQQGQGKPQIITGQDGRVYAVDPRSASGTAVTGADGQPLDVGQKQPSEPELVSAGYAGRMQKAEQSLSKIGQAGFPTYGTTVAANMPLPFVNKNPVAHRAVERVYMTPAQRQYRQQQEDWVRAKLRKESGAVIADDEMQREIETYFPQPGEDAGTIAMKARSRAAAIEAMMTASGKARDRASNVANARPPLESFGQ